MKLSSATIAGLTLTCTSVPRAQNDNSPQQLQWLTPALSAGTACIYSINLS